MWHLLRVDRYGPEVLAGVFQWPTCADVVVLIDDCASHAYRVPTDDPDVDLFAPTRVHWFYGLSVDVGIVWVLRTMLTLPRPDQPDGLPPLVPAPAGIGVPGERLPVVIRKR